MAPTGSAKREGLRLPTGLRPSSTVLLVLLTLGAAASAARAQPYFDAPWRAFDAVDEPLGAETMMSVAVGDLDGDDLPDLVAGQWGSNSPGFPPGVSGVYVFRNLGDEFGGPATFARSTFYEVLYGVRGIELVDLDNDGDLDVAAATLDNGFGINPGNVTLLLNDGTGVLGPPAYLPAGDDGPESIAAADLDGDGDIDLAVANYGSFGSGDTVSVFFNNGDATFAPRATYTIEEKHLDDIIAVDLNQDGAPELVVAHENFGSAQVSVLPNDGSGAFGPIRSYPFIYSAQVDGNVVACDPDRDGDMDLVFSPLAVESDGQLGLLRNDGTGEFATEYYPYGLWQYDRAFDLAVADLNGDGIDDIVGGQLFEAGVVTFLADGEGGFGSGRMVPSVPDAIAVAVADLDLDGDTDLIAVDDFWPLLAVHENPGGGMFNVRPQFGEVFSPNVLDMGDVDGDGDRDAAISHGGAVSGAVHVYLNESDGTFSESYKSPGSSYAYAHLHDLDGDGNLDLLFTSGPNAPPYDFFTARGFGDGTFGPTIRWLIGTCGSAYPGAFDLDNDGDLDVVNTEDRGCAGGADNSLYVSLNQGDGTFAPHIKVPVSPLVDNVAAGDFDEDGILDLITMAGSSKLLLGLGDGRFAPERALAADLWALNAIVDDLDGDGHLDIASHGVQELRGTLRVLWGDGTGQFEVSDFARIPSLGNWIEPTDLDGDGDTDFVSTGVQDAVVFVNGEGRSFTYEGRYGIGRDSAAVHVADADADAIPDLVAIVRLDRDPSSVSGGLSFVPGLRGGPSLTVTIEPSATSVLLPAEGGSVQFTLTVTNPGEVAETVDLWTAFTGPMSREPALGPRTLTIAAGSTFKDTLTQTIPGGAPAGAYSYTVKLGTLGGALLASDSFSFTKKSLLAPIDPLE